MTDKTKLSAINASLDAVGGVDGPTKGKILEQLRRDGHVTDDMGNIAIKAASEGKKQLQLLRTPLQAAGIPAQRHLVQRALATARRYGCHIKDDQLIDLVTLNEELRRSHASIDERIALKTLMASCNLI
jgi:hypothetical protein